MHNNMGFEKTLRDLVKVNGLRKTARDLGLDPGNLFRSLMDGSNLKLNTIQAIGNYFGYELKLVKRKEVKPIKSKPPKSRRNQKRR